MELQILEKRIVSKDVELVYGVKEKASSGDSKYA